MSGDVQPRKRKDKKRRKDEGEQIPIQTHAPPPTNPSSDDVNIHVHKEDGTGGGICAKLVFFVLLSALVVVIGMIITQYRGLTDVENVDTESRFSQIFEGWIDSGPYHHDEHAEEILDDHDLDHDEDDEHNASEEDEEEEEEHDPSEEADEEEDENVGDAEVSGERNEDDEDEDDDQDEDEAQAEEESEENQLDEDEDDDVLASEESETYESEEKDEDEEDNDDEQDHDEDEQELENIESEEDKDEDDDTGDEVPTEKKDQEDADEDEDEDDANAEKALKRAEVSSAKDDSIPKEEKQQESAGMAVKLGVGVALLVVAHLVLVRKWRTASDDKPKPPKEESNEATPNLSRRNTIVMPPTFQEVEPDMEPEEEYSEEEELSEEEVHETKSAKTRYQELRSTYTRSLTPEGEIDYHKPNETYDDEYEENVDEEEEEEISEEEEEDDEKQESEEDDEKQESEEEEDEYDEDEDEELLKRLEAKYGKLREGASERQADVENSDSEKSGDGAGYQYSNITNKDDYKIKSDIDEAQKSVQNNSPYAIKLFDKILQKHPSSPRSIYGKALALDYLADQRRSNDILQQALKFYTQLFNMRNVPNALFEVAAERCINRMRFVGQYKNAINVHKLLIQRFPDSPKYSSDLAVTYLTINRIKEARAVLLKILDKWPDDGFALVHYGFILKTADNRLEEAVDYLQRGLETKVEGVMDGRFYFHLGDALARLGQNDKAMKVYEEGVKNKVFLSKYQRSLYNVARLTGKPWWDPLDLPYLDLFRLLRQNWRKIRDEGLAVLNEKGYFQDESENLKDTGDWKQFELFARGLRNSNCRLCPVTCSIIDRIPEARSCKRGQTKFSVMHPGTHVWPHCGPTNCRLRVHLGLKVPPKTFIRVADETRSWEEGEIFVFDDSFEHEVWHNGTEFRLVLIVDVWHPELTAAEKRSLSPI